MRDTLDPYDPLSGPGRGPGYPPHRANERFRFKRGV